MIMMALLLALFFFASTAQPVEPASITVARIWDQYSKLVIGRDAESLSNLFAADARVMAPNSDDIVGREDIKALFVGIFNDRVKPIDIRVMPREVTGYDGVIYDLGDYVQTMAPLGNPRAAYDVYGRYFAVWVQQADASWKLARIMQSPKKQPAPK
jgi:uncharacterized protein (TIGR02246 family)